MEVQRGKRRRDAILLVATGLAALVLAAVAFTGGVEWGVLGRWLRPRTPAIAFAGLAAILLWTAARRFGLGGPKGVGSGERTQPVLSWWMVTAAAAVIAGVAWSATAWLISEANNAKDPAASRIDAIKTGLSIGAGTGGVFALLLAVRRQWHQEVSTAETARDAAERRITELYTKAVEQLGSEKAPVRLGGLYALERLAQDNRTQRQTIVNVLCAYLRMPYSPAPVVDVSDGAPQVGDPQDTGQHTADAAPTSSDRADDRKEEFQVRLAAQRILADHLRPHGEEPDALPNPRFWGGTDIDLTGATLIDTDFSECHLHVAQFTNARFIGGVSFSEARFNRDAWFFAARFTDADYTWFDGAHFCGRAEFSQVWFGPYTEFGEAFFGGRAGFYQSRFSGYAGFGQVKFNDGCTFGEAQFDGGVGLDGAWVRIDADVQTELPDHWVVQAPDNVAGGTLPGLAGSWGFGRTDQDDPA